MIAAAYGHKIGLAVIAAARYGGLYSHLHSHFHSHAAAIGIEYIIHTLGCNFQEHFAQRDGRVVCQAAEHYMAHMRKLLGSSGIYYRIVISMNGAPPRRHSVHKFGAVRQRDDASVGMVYLVGRQRIYGRSIRMP